MDKWVVVASVWVVAIGSAVVLIYEINRPLVLNPADAMSAVSEPGVRGRQEVDEPVVDPEEPEVLLMPMVTIVGSRRGAAEMQGVDDVVIGPGIVTHLK